MSGIGRYANDVAPSIGNEDSRTGQTWHAVSRDDTFRVLRSRAPGCRAVSPGDVALAGVAVRHGQV